VRRTARRFASPDGPSDASLGSQADRRAGFHVDDGFSAVPGTHVPWTRCGGRCRAGEGTGRLWVGLASWWAAHQVDGFDLAQEGEQAAAAVTGEGNGFGELGGGFAELS